VAVLLASLSSLTWGISDFVGGMTTRRVAVFVVVFWSQLVGLAVASAAAPLFGGTLSPQSALWGALGGLGGSVGILALYRGLARGRAAVVAPVAAVTGAAVPLVVGVATGDRPVLTAWMGIVLALPAIWLVSRSHRHESAVGFGDGVVAGLGFGAFFVLLAFTADDAGLWPLVPARAASLAMVGIALILRRENARPHPSPVLVGGIVVAGAGDMLANMLYLSATQRGLLSVVAVVASLYPAVTVTLARAFGERVVATQWLGVGLSLAAVGLIAA
jgi:drug/metabolite transporter (DMT)-like permease